jgi:hypothetical protein
MASSAFSNRSLIFLTCLNAASVLESLAPKVRKSLACLFVAALACGIGGASRNREDAVAESVPASFIPASI